MFPPVLAIIFAIITGLCISAAGGRFFRRYLNEQIYKERVSQLTESTELLYTNLENTLDSQWIYLSGIVSGLNYQHPGNILQMRSYLRNVISQLEMEQLGCRIILLDDKGIFYDSNGKQGIWSGSAEIDDLQKRQSFLTDSMGSSENQMAFAEKLPQSLVIMKGTEEICITHAVLLKDMSALTPYFRSNAYSNDNLTYILRDNGVKMYSDEQQKTSFLKGRNAFRTLEEMEYTHYADFESCKADLDKNGFVCANVFYEGQEYYYCLKKIADYDWTMLFLVSADSVAANTMNMINSIVHTFFVLTGAALALLCAGFYIWYRNRKTRSLYQFELESNERLSEVNQQLEAAKKAAEEAFHIAEEANQSKSQFLSNMSHDMRTPMNAIVGFTTLLGKANNDPEKVKEYTRKIAFSSRHLLGLINDVLDMSKIEAGKMQLSLEEENMDEIIENIDILVRPQTMAKRQQFDVVTENLLHKIVMVDRLRLNQILQNLLSNAVKYTPQGGHIRLCVQELPQRSAACANYRFIVEDNGYGMSEEYVKNVFQVFSREEDTRINKIQGSGLGMAITKNLVNLMGGSISVRSQKGAGSTFTLDLELCISEKLVWSQHGESSAVEKEAQILKDMHVLVVEDNEINAEIIVELLKMEGAVCTVCENGQEAVDMFGQSSPGEIDLILMDVQMPVMNGYEATKAIRKSGHPMAEKIPIIAMTANAFVEDIHDALDAGMNAHVAKPVDMKVLKETVRQVLDEA
ncbi:response regulator [Blautia sp. MSJ-19]|nr:response regulator [Blautia sp. MSJ-19]